MSSFDSDTFESESDMRIGSGHGGRPFFVVQGFGGHDVHRVQQSV